MAALSDTPSLSPPDQTNVVRTSGGDAREAIEKSRQAIKESINAMARASRILDGQRE